MPISTEDLIAFLADALGIADDLGPDTELFSSGLLDSVAMMNIIAFIEDRAGIDIRPADVTLDNFDTVQRIVDHVRNEC